MVVDSYDSDDEENNAYFYDLVLRSGEVEHYLKKLGSHRMFVMWKHPLKHSRLLSIEEVDKLLDADYVDWHDFHLSYLHSICNRRATSKGKEHLSRRSHDQIDDLFALSKELQKDHPEFIKDASQHKKNEWQSCIAAMALEYARFVNMDLLNVGVDGDLSSKVRDILRKPWEPLDTYHGETIYYIAGVVINMIDNMATPGRSKEVYAAAFRDMKKNAMTTKLEASNNPSLPSGKVESREKVELCYANNEFYEFVNKIESVFHTLLSEGSVALYGPSIIADITHVLSNEDLGADAFFTNTHEFEVKAEVLRRIIWSFARLRGKDFVRKCNAKMGSKHHETTRATLGVLSAVASANAKNGNDGDGLLNAEEDNPRWQYLLKQPKKDLVAMCKNRSLHYSGSKKVLARIRSEIVCL